MNKRSAVLFIIMLFVLGAYSVMGYNIQVTKVSQDPVNAIPNRVVDLKIMVQNLDSMSLNNVTLTLDPQYPFKAYRVLSRTFSLVPYQQGVDAYIIDYKLLVLPDSPSGTYNVTYTCQYKTETGTISSFTGTIPVDIQNEETYLTVPVISVSPDVLKPGNFANLSFSLENSGSTIARNTVVTIVLPHGIGISDSVNNRYISYFYPHVQKTMNFKLFVSPDVAPGVYTGYVYLQYSNDDKSMTYYKNVSFNTVVGVFDNVSIFVSKNQLTVNKSSDVTFTVVNKGTSPIKFTTVKLLPSSDYTIISGDTFIGKIDNDDYDIADFTIIPKKENVSLNYVLTWQNFFNSPRSEKGHIETTAQVIAPAKSKAKMKLYSIILVVVLLTIFWVFMLIDSFMTKRENKVKKILWIVIVIVTFYLGALLYYLFGRNKED